MSNQYLTSQIWTKLEFYIVSVANFSLPIYFDKNLLWKQWVRNSLANIK